MPANNGITFAVQSLSDFGNPREPSMDPDDTPDFLVARQREPGSFATIAAVFFSETAAREWIERQFDPTKYDLYRKMVP